MLLLGEGSEATEPYNKYDKIRPNSIRSLQFDQKVRPLYFRPEKFDFLQPPNHRQTYSKTKLKNWKKVLQLKFIPLSDIMDLRHQSSAMCIIMLGGEDTHTWSATKVGNPIQGCQEYAGRVFAYSRIFLAFDVPHMQLHIFEKSTLTGKSNVPNRYSKIKQVKNTENK